MYVVLSYNVVGPTVHHYHLCSLYKERVQEGYNLYRPYELSRKEYAPMAGPSQAELERLWKERCQTGNFSPAVLGAGTIRVMGKSGH